MLINYLKTALRNLIKHKTYSFIHIAGLTIGIACLVLIFKYVQYELSFDQFNKNADRIYRIAGYDWAQTPVPLSTELCHFYPEIINTVQIRKVDKVLLGCDRKIFYEEGVVFSDPSIFNVFTFPLTDGNPQAVLNDPYSVVISQDMAKKYFGLENPVGKIFTYDDKYNFTVTGIFKNIPKHSHIIFDFVFSLKSADKIFYKDFFENRMNTVVYNYFLLNKNNNISSLQSRIMEFTKHYLGEEFFKATREGKWRIEYQIQSLTSIHLRSNLGGEFEPNGDITSVYIFFAIAVLILLIACINYINLSTARFMNRLKEIGIRKAIGANRLQIIFQFVGESVLFSFFALAIAVVLIEILTPWLGSELGEKEMFASGIFEVAFFLLGIALFTGLVSGLFPALFISRFNPSNILSKTISKSNKRFNYGNVLISFQFVVSTVLIIALIIVSSQLSYIQNKRLGFNKEQIVVVPLNDNSLRSQYNILKDELMQQQGIVGITASSIIPGGVKWVRSFRWEGQNIKDENTMSYISADRDFLKTYQIKIIEGRDFSQSLSTDTSRGFLLNEAAMAKLGWKSPIGKGIETFGKGGAVIGLMKDFHFKSLHEKIEPLVIYSDQGSYEYLSIRIKTKNVPDVLNSIEKKWKSFSQEKPYEYFFLDDYWGNLYKKEQNMKNLFSVFSGFAIFIASLGLFGLSAFNAQNKTKEIGIRKILGASVAEIVALLSKDFAKWVLIANIIAWPVAYYLMNKWLEDFAYRINISLWVFALAGGIALVIALATVSFQAIKAAVANPVESLRYE